MKLSAPRLTRTALAVWFVTMLGCAPQRVMADAIARVILDRQYLALRSSSLDTMSAQQVTQLRILAAEDEDLLRSLAEAQDLTALADALERAQRVSDLDLLAFEDLLSDVVDTPPPSVSRPTLNRLRALRSRLTDARRQLDREASPTRGEQPRGTGRNLWEEYRSRLVQLAPAPQLPEVPSAEEMRGKYPAEEWGDALQEGQFILTFDDGPDRRRTPRVLAALRAAGVRATFFVVGNRFSTRGAAGDPALSAEAELLRAELADGHAIGNHTFSHPLLTRLAREEQFEELDTTWRLIEQATGVPTVLFRPPYGGRSMDVMEKLAEAHERSVMWTIDSEDWADPVPASISARVLDAARVRRRGIILLHDIHSQTVEALPGILDGLRRPRRYIQWHSYPGVIPCESLARKVLSARSPSP